MVFAVCRIELPEGIPLNMSPQLDASLRAAVRPQMDSDDEVSYTLASGDANFVLAWHLEQKPCWSGQDLYRLGAELKCMEHTKVETFALPQG